ncbi:MAG: hypothetical protein GY856_13820 [bacterium]|nr:hypothetical protein [bacterium]
MTHILLAALVFLSGAASAPPVHGEAIPPIPEQYLYDSWQREDGLPQISVLAIAQDPRGYLWLGTQEGLVRFDGVRFTVFDRENTPQIRSGYVEALITDRDGSLWIATHGGLLRLADGQFTLYTTADGLAHDHLRALHQDRAGRLWIGTAGGLSCLDRGTFTSFTTRDGLIHDSVWAILEDRHGEVWIGTEGGLSRLKDDSFTSYTSRQGLSHDHVLALHEDRRGRLRIATTQGLHRFDNGRFIDDSAREDLLHPAVWSFHEDHQGNLWMGTDGGLSRLSDDVLTTYTIADGLPDDRVRAILEDREGSLWIGTRHGGLGRLRKGTITSFGRPEGLADDLVWTIYQDREGSVWIGTDNGLTRIAPDGALSTYTTRDGLPGPTVRALCEDRRGNLWIGTFHGLARLRGGEFRIYTTADGLGSSSVFAIEEDREGSLWFGTFDGGLTRLKDGELRTYTTEDGLPDNRITALHSDPQGVLWIGTNGGLSRYQDGVFTTFNRRGGPADDRARSLHSDREGNLWIGTAEAGLSRFRDGEITHFSAEDGLFDNRVYRILEDGRGGLWMTSNRGIFRVSKQALEDFAAGRIPTIPSVSYSESDGLRSSECNGGSQPAGWRTRDGRLWFPTLKGVATIDGENPRINPVPPPVYIEEVLIDEQPSDPDRRAELGPGTRAIEFRYVALSFIAPEKIRFRYQLEGFQDEWVDAGPRRSAYFTNLTPGEYRFRVIAANSDGVWNESGDAFDFYVRPAVYQTWTFYVGCVLAAALLGRGIHRFRVRQLLHHNRELRRMQKELEAKNVEVEAKNAEMERFTYAVSHDLKSPLFTVEGFLGLLERDAARGDVERMSQDMRQIRTATANMRRLLDELLELSRIGRMDNPSQEVSLGELAREAVERVGGRIAERGVEIVISPDLGMVFGDRPRLLEVLQNLIDNAVKFIGAQEEPRVEIGLRREDGENVYWVRDNGIGINPRYQEKIFGLFEKLDPKAEGTGIGLALVKRIIEVHGGRIRIESAGEGRGTTFCFTLRPKAEAAGKEE